MTEKHKKVCEELGWSVNDCEDGEVELVKYSPAGEEYSIYAQAESFVSDVKYHAAYFDPDDHAEEWVRARQQNCGYGIPSLRELIEDADEINNMLQELAAALAETEA